MAEILNAVVLPTGKLSLEVAPGAGVSGVTKYKVTLTPVDPLEEVVLEVPVEEMAGFDVVRGTHFLRVPTVLSAEEYQVTVRPMVGLAEVGTVSAAVEVDGAVNPYWEELLRQRVAELLAGAGLAYEGYTLIVCMDRMGRAATAVAQLGHTGIYIVVGVPYMTTSDTFVDSSVTQELITLPVTVYVKAAHPDGAIAAVAVAARARRKINAADFTGMGVTNWTWSGEAPDDSGEKQIAVRMQLQFAVEFLREECGDE